MQYGIGNLAQRPEFGLGDFISDVFKPVRSVVNKVVPRELKPILPVVASAFLGPAVGGMFSALGPAAAGFLGAGTTSALTQALTGSGQIDPMSTLLSAGIGGIQGARVPKDFTGTEQISGPVKKPTFDQRPGMDTILPDAPTFQAPVTFTPGTEAYDAAMKNAGFFDRALMTAKEYTGSTSLNPATGRLQYDRGPEGFLKGATAFSLPYTSKAAAEEAIDLEEQERQGQIESAAQRRKDKEIYIDYVMRAGFTREEAERMADGAGYEEGGEVRLASDPDPADDRNTMRENFAPRLFKGRTLDKLSDDEVIELDEAIEEMTKRGIIKEKRMTANTGEFAGLETLMQINDATGFPQIRPAIETEEYPETSKNVDSQRKETLGENYVSGKDVMEIDSYLSETFSEEEANEYRKQIVKYQDQGKGSNSFFDAILGMGFNEGGQVPGLPRGKQVDAREGMFIPMGGAKRADDVPAMLSVNEFVLNDNAVAGLGQLMTGSPDPRAGARALYKIQDQLEAMVV
jgi:hypothetical protein